MKRNKWTYKVLACFFGIMASVAIFSGCNSDENGSIPVSLPDYGNEQEMNMIGYVNPTDGSYTFAGIPMNSGTNYRTVENFKDYKDAGFNVAFARYDGALEKDVTAETWPLSGTKEMCDAAYEAGIDKILITDEFFDAMVHYTDGKLVGSGVNDMYKKQEEFDEVVANRLSIYKDTPGFYGIIMLDEPRYHQFENYATVHKSLRRIMPEMYIYNNLFYCFSSGMDIYVNQAKWKEEHDGKAPTLGEAYRHYISTFLEMTEADNLAVDIYPYCDTPEERIRNFYSNIQVVKELCDEYGAELSWTLQSISYINDGVVSKRTVNKNDMWQQMNAVLGFGAKSVQYYTYFPYPSYTASSTSVGNFIDREGNKTSVYYNGKSVNEGVRKFDEVLLHYEFQGAKMYLNNPLKTGASNDYLSSGSIAFDNSWEHTLLKTLTQDNDALLTTELKDEKNGLYMYMIMNAIDSWFSQNGEMSYTECTFTAEFPGYDYVAEFDCGELTYVKLDNGKYTKSLSAGYGVYLIPLKVA